MIDVWGFSCETATRLMLLDLSDDKSTLFQVMKKKNLVYGRTVIDNYHIDILTYQGYR